MKVGQVYRTADSRLIYVVIEDYRKLRPLVVWSKCSKVEKEFELICNMSYTLCPGIEHNCSTFYEGDELIANTFKEYLQDMVIHEAILGDD